MKLTLLGVRGVDRGAGGDSSCGTAATPPAWRSPLLTPSCPGSSSTRARVCGAGDARRRTSQFRASEGNSKPPTACLQDRVRDLLVGPSPAETPISKPLSRSTCHIRATRNDTPCPHVSRLSLAPAIAMTSAEAPHSDRLTPGAAEVTRGSRLLGRAPRRARTVQRPGMGGREQYGDRCRRAGLVRGTNAARAAPRPTRMATMSRVGTARMIVPAAAAVSPSGVVALVAAATGIIQSSPLRSPSASPRRRWSGRRRTISHPPAQGDGWRSDDRLPGPAATTSLCQARSWSNRAAR